MAREKDYLDRYGEDICNALGFNPTSNSTKPLSIANACSVPAWEQSAI